MSQILIVDDNRMNRLLLSRGIEQMGHQVAFAENGRQALDLIAREAYDLILLDVEMPELDGYQVLGKLRGDIHLREIPVIITSSLDEIDGVVKCIELGAEDYLHKPVNPVLLKARVNASLEKKKLRDQQRDFISKFATEQVAEDLLTSGFALGGKYVEATALFCDIRSFTTLAEAQPPDQTIELLNDYYTLMMDAIGGEGGIVNQFGAPVERADHAVRAARAALQMVDLIELFNAELRASNRQPIRIGIGIATGQVIAGYTGTMRRATYTCVGDAVNVAARLESYTKVSGDRILINEQTRVQLDESFAVIDKGEIEIKGKTYPVCVFAVASTRHP